VPATAGVRPGRRPAPRSVAALFLAAVILTGGCGGQATGPARTSGSASATTSPGVTVTPSSDAHFASLVDIAVADLAGRLHVDAASVTVVSVRPMEWPDRSAGCPQPGMVYPQVPVDGALIELSAGGKVYRYHSGGSRAPFLCENTIP